MQVDDDLVRRVEIELEAMTEYAWGFCDGRQPHSGNHRALVRADIQRAEKVLAEVDELWGGDDGE